MNATIDMKARPSLATLDQIRADYARPDLDEEGRAAIRQWINAEIDEQRLAWRRDEQAWAEGREGSSYNKVLVEALKGIQAEEVKRETARANQVYLKHLADKAAAQEKQREERDQRWRALSPIERALYVVAAEERSEALLRVVQLARDPESTAKLTSHRIPDAFEACP